MNAYLVIVLEEKDKTSSHVLSEIFSPLFLIRGGGGDEKSLEKWESGTGVTKKLKILAWVRLVIVFFYILKN